MSIKNHKKLTFGNYLLGLMALFLFVGCQASPTATSTALPPIKTASPAPTTTPTLAYQPESVSMENSGAWEFSRPLVFEDWNQWIISDNETYKLDDEYEIESVDLSYQWWGMGGPSFEYQQIKRTGDVYKLNGRVVVKEKITNLVKSLSNLHAVPQTLNSITHTDDYPIWAVEITGSDGTKILLTSDSNTSLYVPWNVIYNGDIYAQYDGSVEVALADLFSVSEGEPMAAFYPGEGEEGKLIVSTGGWPKQLSYGFNGLLPVHTSFSYWTSPETGEIIGIFDGRSSIGGFGNMVIGSIDNLERIVLEKDDGSKTNCDIETLESDDPSAKQWKFSCALTEPNAVGSYYYPIKVTFGTDKGERITSEGNLFGYWQRGINLSKTIFPLEISDSLKDSEEFKKLAENHQIILYSFDAQVDQSTGNLSEGMNADVVLLGQINYKGKVLPYSVTTSMGIKNGKIIRWDIDELELQNLISDILNQNITNNLLEAGQNPVLNLYYFEANTYVDIGYSEGMTSSGRNWYQLGECKGYPWIEELPNETTALREFSVNSGWSKFDSQFILIDDEVRLYDYRGTNLVNENNLLSFLLPKKIMISELPPLEISGQFRYGFYMFFVWGDNATQEEIETYTNMINNLPGKKDFFDWGVKIDDVIFAVNEDGAFDMVECKSLQP
ncbi:MAG TPA: hypothetical protein PKJ84_05345 [Anaerolineales bacterium]|nr:hypothetical protein [Anaerolineales bacterium]HNO93572.1 hypothetical protein [Anaerolineales bacterium]